MVTRPCSLLSLATAVPPFVVEQAAAKELGRRAFAAGISLLDVCRMHQELALEVLVDTRPEEYVAVTDVAGELLLEMLGAYDMTHRSVLGP